MSIEAVTWAFKQDIRPSATKFVLVAVANCANENGIAYPSVAYLANATCQDRKTVITAIDRLADLGFIEDTGQRTGRTKQIKVYRLRDPTVPKTVQLNSTENDTASASSSTKNGTDPEVETVPFFPETVPFFPGNSTVFPGKSTENGTRNRQEPLQEPLGTETSVVNGARRRAKKNPPFTIPEDWRPSERVYTWAGQRGISRESVDAQIDEFVVYWRGRGDARPGWDATFMNRLGRLIGPPGQQHVIARPKPQARTSDDFSSRTYTGTPIDDIDWIKPGDT